MKATWSEWREIAHWAWLISLYVISNVESHISCQGMAFYYELTQYVFIVSCPVCENNDVREFGFYFDMIIWRGNGEDEALEGGD